MGIGDRLKVERERLGLSQTEFAALAGASKNSQYNYEKGERSPDANYLAAAAAQGVDVLYVVTGERRLGPFDSLSEREASVLARMKEMKADDLEVLERLTEAFVVSQKQRSIRRSDA